MYIHTCIIVWSQGRNQITFPDDEVFEMGLERWRQDEELRAFQEEGPVVYTRGDRQAHPFYPPSTLDHLLTPEGVTDFQHLSSGLPSSSPENLLSFDSTYTNHQFSRLVMSNSLRPHGLQHARPPCPTPTPRVYSNSCHWVGDAIQPSHSLPSPSPPAFNLSQHQGLFQWVSFSHQVAKVLDEMIGWHHQL